MGVCGDGGSPAAGRMDAEGIVRWMQRRAGPSATLLQDTDTAAAFINAQDIVVVGFFKVGQGPGWGWARARAGLMVGPCRTCRARRPRRSTRRLARWWTWRSV